jgi:hypothetical protein
MKEKAGKFSVSVERVVNLGNYETLRVGLAEVLDLDADKPDIAYARILEKVDAWTSQLKPGKSTVSAAQQPARSPGATEGPTIRSEDPYFSLPWKQSQKKSNLATIRVTTELLENPIARELYDRLMIVTTMKVNQVSYRYSKMPDGTEFLQKWIPIKVS